MERNELQVFENETFGEIRMVLIDNEPWFVAADVCKILEHTNIKQWKDDLDIEIKTTWQEYKPTINELLNFRDGDKAIQYLVERGLNTNSLMK